MTTISDCILALLDVSYEQTSEQIIAHVYRPTKNCEEDVRDELRQLIRERWLYYTPAMTLRRRTQAQWDALMAANNPQQGSLL
jgi:hypothetical protein